MDTLTKKAESLELRVKNVFEKYKIKQGQRDSINVYLGLLRNCDIPTYEHSLRVGLKGVEVAEFLHLPPKIFFYSGLLHDIGKALTKPESLKKTEGFNENDMEELRKHPLYSYKLIRGIHAFSAEIVLRHHTCQENPYPKVIPKPKEFFSRNTKINIDYYARILSLVDFYDAASTRKNNKFSGDEVRLLLSDQVKEIMMEKNKDQKHLINELYVAGIF